jgi:hypothetical protein
MCDVIINVIDVESVLKKVCYVLDLKSFNKIIRKRENV